MNHLLKKGYINGYKTIEIQEGNIDLILHNEKETSFFFYRFSGEQIFGQALDKQVCLVSEKQIGGFIRKFGKEYEGLINELIQYAVENQLTERYDI